MIDIIQEEIHAIKFDDLKVGDIFTGFDNATVAYIKVDPIQLIRPKSSICANATCTAICLNDGRPVCFYNENMVKLKKATLTLRDYD